MKNSINNPTLVDLYIVYSLTFASKFPRMYLVSALLEDFPPKRFFDEPIKSGPYKGSGFDRDEWLIMLKEYYSLHGWDPQTGLQTEATLMELNLPFLIDKLKDANKLPI